MHRPWIFNLCALTTVTLAIVVVDNSLRAAEPIWDLSAAGFAPVSTTGTSSQADTPSHDTTISSQARK